MAMTLEQAMRTVAEKIANDTPTWKAWGVLCAYLAQPAQAVDVTDDDVEAAGAAYFEQQWDMLPTRSKAIYRNALRRALKSFATRALSAEKAGCQHDWAIGYGVPAYCNKCGEPMTLPASPTPDKEG